MGMQLSQQLDIFVVKHIHKIPLLYKNQILDFLETLSLMEFYNNNSFVNEMDRFFTTMSWVVESWALRLFGHKIRSLSLAFRPAFPVSNE